MAKNRKPLVESDSDGSQELTQSSKKPLAAKKPRLMAASKAAPSPTSSESGSESDSDPKGSPIPTQPSNGSIPKSSAADLVTPTRKRRAAEEKDANDSKKKKKKGEPESSITPKKSSTNRVWSEHDEIVIVQGMFDYCVEKKADPMADVNAFLDFIKNNLQKKDVVKQKLQEKIRKLKIKYENNKKKESFSNPHEKTLYELSNSVWGNKATDKEDVAAMDDEAETEAANGVKSMGETVEEEENGVKSMGVTVEEEENGVKSMGVTVEEEENGVKSLGVTVEEEENGVKTMGVTVEEEEEERVEKEWKKLYLEEMKLNLRLLEVKTAMARLDFERFISEG